MNSNKNVIAYFVYDPDQTTRIISLSGDLSFGNVQAGSTSTRTLRISNTGNSTLHVNGITYPAGFSGNWYGDISPGSYHDVTVTFAPTQVKTYSEDLTVSSNKTSGTNTKYISGTGISDPDTRVISLSGDTTFGDVYVDTTTGTILIINNTGNSTLTVYSINYSTEGFSGSWAGNIPAGGSQDVHVYFTPTQEKYYSGTLTVNSDKTGGTNTKSINGTGIQIDPPTVTTLYVNDIECYEVEAYGRVDSTGGANITEKGFEYEALDGSESGKSPCWDGNSGTGTYHRTLNMLECETDYKYRAYAINEANKTGYGAWDYFTTDSPTPPKVSWDINNINFTDVTTTSITVHGNLDNAYGIPILWVGTKYSSWDWPTCCSIYDKDHTVGANPEEGPFEITVRGLDPETKYWFAPYALNIEDQEGDVGGPYWRSKWTLGDSSFTITTRYFTGFGPLFEGSVYYILYREDYSIADTSPRNTFGINEYTFTELWSGTYHVEAYELLPDFSIEFLGENRNMDVAKHEHQTEAVILW